MASETKSVVVSGKKVKMVTFSDEEVHPELMYSYMTNGSVNARIVLTSDTTNTLPRKVRDILVKKVFKGG